MSLQNIIAGLRRVPWFVMKSLLEHHRLSKGREWDETIPKLEDIPVKSPEKEQALIETLLSIPNSPFKNICRHRLKTDHLERLVPIEY